MNSPAQISALLCALVLVGAVSSAAATTLKIETLNPLPIKRNAQTIELSAAQLASLGETNLQRIHVSDATGKEVLCQAVDTNFDAYHRPDIVIFQADFEASEKKTFTVSVGPKQVYQLPQFKAHGRFVRERFDDFAWENDLIAHRMYGKGLETWAGEPLTSSTVDIWSKRTPQMVIDRWYMVDDYHTDTGQGADFYSAGPSRGCGGNGLWAADKLWLSKNFVESRVLANGPMRVMFELVYEAFDVNGAKISEVKRITLDAGSQLDRFQSTYSSNPGPPLVSAAGLKKTAGQEKRFDADNGWLAVWEKVAKNQGTQGLAIVAEPQSLQGESEDKLNHLLRLKCNRGNAATYWAGFCWDKAGHITNFEDWQKYLTQFAQSLKTPVQVQIQEN